MANVTHERRKALGLCLDCDNPHRPGFRCCQACADRRREDAAVKRKEPGYATTRQRRAAVGLCQCGVVPEPGFKFCADCRTRSVHKQRRHQAKKRAAGLCCVCGKQIEEAGHRHCLSCREKRQERSRRRKEAGLCLKCRTPVADGKVHCHPCRAIHNEQCKARNRKRKRQVFDHYGWACRCCGCTFPDHLSIDHVHGGGTKHREQLGGRNSTNFWKWLVRNNFPEGYQTLCFSCNCAKGFRGRCGCQDWTPDRLKATAGTLTVF